MAFKDAHLAPLPAATRCGCFSALVALARSARTARARARAARPRPRHVPEPDPAPGPRRAGVGVVLDRGAETTDGRPDEREEELLGRGVERQARDHGENLRAQREVAHEDLRARPAPAANGPERARRAARPPRRCGSSSSPSSSTPSSRTSSTTRTTTASTPSRRSRAPRRRPFLRRRLYAGLGNTGRGSGGGSASPFFRRRDGRPGPRARALDSSTSDDARRSARRRGTSQY